MPTYEYICKECNKTFVVISTISQHEKDQKPKNETWSWIWWGMGLTFGERMEQTFDAFPNAKIEIFIACKSERKESEEENEAFPQFDLAIHWEHKEQGNASQ